MLVTSPTDLVIVEDTLSSRPSIKQRKWNLGLTTLWWSWTQLVTEVYVGITCEEGQVENEGLF